MSSAGFGSWAVAESPVTISYSLSAIEEIRRQAAEGFQKLARRGLEAGGILYGSRDGRSVSVMAVRPIQCEHARGPALLLSDRDRETLDRQVQSKPYDPLLEGMLCVGWFVSHTRSEIVLSDSDLEIYSKYFGAPWQVTLVIRPARGGGMRAGFFVREPDGTVRSDSSYQEFDLAAPVEPTETIEPLELDGPQFLPPPPRRSKWPWLVGWAVGVLILAMVLLQYFGVLSPRAVPISLSVAERDGQLQIQWDQNARPVTAAAQGSLTIVDGGDVHTVALTPPDLARGTFFYFRNSGDVQVRLVVTAPTGKKLGEEASRFLGRPPIEADPNEMQDLQRQRDELQAEVEQLKQQNQAAEERVQVLERTLRILQARLGLK